MLPTRAVSQDEYDVQAAQRTETFAEYESSGADVEAAGAAIASAEAAVETADAILAQARLELEYTEIHAPITGRISRKLITVGNYVTGGVENSAVLTTIASTDPIHSYFDADEQSFLKYVRLSRDGTRASSREVKNPVYMALSDEKQGFPHRGYMDFVDNRLDPNTGSMRGRAIFPNPDWRFNARALRPTAAPRQRRVRSHAHPRPRAGRGPIGNLRLHPRRRKQAGTPDGRTRPAPLRAADHSHRSQRATNK